jgi:hypothetical protein
VPHGSNDTHRFGGLGIAPNCGSDWEPVNPLGGLLVTKLTTLILRKRRLFLSNPRFQTDPPPVAAEYCLPRGGMLVAAWGIPKGKAATRRLIAGRFEEIRRLGLPLHILRMTASGYPEHPLMLPAILRPVPWLI